MNVDRRADRRGRTVSVVGSASVSVAPDVARLNCGVQVHGSNAQDALRRANEAMQAILAAARDAGVAGADLRTRGPFLMPGERGYIGSNEVSIVVRDLGAVGSVIDPVVSVGGPEVTMRGVTFSVSDPGAHLSDARRAAMESAHAVASELAEAGGASVGEVVTIVESASPSTPGGFEPRAMRAAATPVEGGEQELRVEVAVTYRLVDPPATA